MKVAILAGGTGSRISEESVLRPKPMIEIGGRPILWHIMKNYAAQGFKEFVILLGYKSHVIKDFFKNYYLYQCDVTIDTSKNSIHYHNSSPEDWRITLVETGLETMTGGRLKRAQKYLDNEPFMLTYGDGLADLNFRDLLEFHQTQKKILTLTAIQPEGRFGILDIDSEGVVNRFLEKPATNGTWINGGFFVCQPEVFEYLQGDDDCVFERAPLESLSKQGQLSAFRHEGFWMCMDTLRDKIQLNNLWNSNKARWKIWN